MSDPNKLGLESVGSTLPITDDNVAIQKQLEFYRQKEVIDTLTAQLAEANKRLEMAKLEGRIEGMIEVHNRALHEYGDESTPDCAVCGWIQVKRMYLAQLRSEAK